MKIIILTAIEEFEQEVKDILKHSGVKSFSMQRVKGFKNSDSSGSHNWFVSEEIATESFVFMVFVESSCVNEILKRVEEFNHSQESLSRIHLASIAVEHFI